MNAIEKRILNQAIAKGFAKEGMECHNVANNTQFYVIAFPSNEHAYGSYEGRLYAINCGKGVYSIHEVLNEMGHYGESLGSVDIKISLESAEQIDWSPSGLQDCVKDLHVNTVIELFKIACDNNLLKRGIPSLSRESSYNLPIICGDGVLIFEVNIDWIDRDDDPENSIEIEGITRISHFVIGNVKTL